jgi:hypothetical protein
VADQLVRAASRVALNIAEAEYSNPGNKRARFFTAAGSANESLAALRVAVAWGYFREDEAEGLVRRVLAMHLDDEERALVLGVLFEELLAWTRSLSGSQKLRALCLFDEVYGFIPPSTRKPADQAPTRRPHETSAPSASASCSRHKTRWTSTTARSATPAGASAACKPTPIAPASSKASAA